MAQPMKRALIVAAKNPAPGEVKTRLSPPFTHEETAELYRCFLLDAFDQCGRLDGVQVTVAYFPPQAQASFEKLVPSYFQALPQSGADLGERMGNAFCWHFDQGYDEVVLVGSDHPTLPPGYLRDAFRLLEEKELVLGPTLDGGYYLIGMQKFHAGVLRGIPWSTERVLSQTLGKARKANISVGLLPPWYDVDDPGDLEKLHKDILLAMEQGRWFPTKTARFLKIDAETSDPCAAT